MSHYRVYVHVLYMCYCAFLTHVHVHTCMYMYMHLYMYMYLYNYFLLATAQNYAYVIEFFGIHVYFYCVLKCRANVQTILATVWCV